MDERNIEKNTLEKLESLRYRKSRISYILKLYSYIGILTFVSAIGLFAFDIHIHINENQRIYIMIAFSGLLLTVMSLIMRDIKKSKERDIFQDEMYILVFLKEWNYFESLLDDFLKKRGVETRKGAINQKIAALYEQQTLDELDLMTVKYLLKIRNQIVHEASFEDFTKIEFALKSLKDLERKITNQKM